MPVGRAVRWGSVVSLVACGSFGDAGTQTGDAGNGDGSTSQPPPDGGAPDDAATPRCDPTKPFSITPVQEIKSDEQETYASLSSDELTIYFSRGTSGPTRDIWTGTRSTKSESFAKIAKHDTFNTEFLEDGLSISTDGRLAVLASTRPDGTGSPNLFFSRRASTDVSFPALQPIPGSVNSTANDNDPYLLLHLNKMYFASNRSGLSEVYVVALTADAFGKVSTVDEINSSGHSDGSPVASADDLEIFFSSDRAGGGGERTYYARRPAPNAPFSAPVDVPELNVAGTTAVPTWLSVDGCILYFSTDRDGNRDIWVATRGK